MKLSQIKPSLKSTPTTLALTAACLLFASSCASAQSAPPPPSSSASPAPTFDVATIKPQAPGERNMFVVRNTPDGMSGSATTLYWLVQSAYGVPTSNQITGGPDWAKTEPYDVQAKMSGSDAEAMKAMSPAQQKTFRQQMLQALLADRFKLKTHSETKQVPTFDLVTTKDISKLKDATTDPNRKMNKDGTPSTGIVFSKDSAQVMGASMKGFAGFLSQPISGVGRPVTDKTGLTGTYEFTLNWSPQWKTQPGASSATMSDDDAASIFTALKEVGLKLQPSTGPIETIVIDHAEHPTAD